MLGGSMTKFVDDHCSDTDGRVSSDGGQLAAASRQIVGRSVCLWYPLPALLCAGLRRIIRVAFGCLLSFVRALALQKR